MPRKTVDFDAHDLVKQIEQLSQYELDGLPFGVIRLNREGTILFYSKTEADQSGYGKIPIGQNLFEISPCMGSDDFRGRIKRASENGPINFEFGWVGDFADPKRELRLRVQSSKDNSIWIFIERDSINGSRG